MSADFELTFTRMRDRAVQRTAERVAEHERRVAAKRQRKSRAPKPPKVLSTHCRHGHEYVECNTYITPSGHRRCRACQEATCRRHYLAKCLKRAAR